METFLSNDEIKKIVIDFTCSFVNISFEELRENRKSRKREHVIPRQIIFYLVGKFTGLGTVDIAENIKNYFLTEEKNNVNSVFTISGNSSQNSGMAYISLKKRKKDNFLGNFH